MPTATPDPALKVYHPAGDGSDDGPALQRLLDEGARRLLIDGPELRIDTPVRLTKGMQPYHGVEIRPTAGVGRTRVTTAIGKFPGDPTNPSYAVFGYAGGYEARSRLTAATAVGATAIQVEQVAGYVVGEHISLFDAATENLIEKDGTSETRKLVAVDPATRTLTLDKPLRRAHMAGIAAPKSNPIFNVTVSDLVFSGDASVAVHLQNAQDCKLERLSTDNWVGRTFLLFDLGGQRNEVRDCVGTGIKPAAGTGATDTVWGVSVESQEDTKIYNCKLDKFGVGIIINYSVDTWAYDSTVSDSTVNINLNHDEQKRGCIRCGFRRGVVTDGHFRGGVIGYNAEDCEIDMTLRENHGYAVEVAEGARNSKVAGIIDSSRGSTSVGIYLGIGTRNTSLAGRITNGEGIGLLVNGDAGGQTLPGFVCESNRAGNVADDDATGGFVVASHDPS